MNLILRLMLLVFKKLWKIEPRSVTETAEADFWCLPHDCDFHGHMTNSRYGSFCDLARISTMFDQKALIPLVRKGCTPIVTAQQLQYFKEVAPLKKFRIKSTILGWDERYWIFQHDFYQAGDLKATALAKGFFVQGKKSIPFAKVLKIGGYSVDSPTLPSYAAAWSEAVQRSRSAST